MGNHGKPGCGQAGVLFWPAKATAAWRAVLTDLPVFRLWNLRSTPARCCRPKRNAAQENRKGRLFGWFGQSTGRNACCWRERHSACLCLISAGPMPPLLRYFMRHLTEKAASMPSHESRLARQPDAASDGHARRESHIRIRSKSKGVEMPLRAISTRTS